MLPLFKYYPIFVKKIPYLKIGDFPTPVEKLKNLGNKFNCKNLYIKRDDLSSDTYGGNKVRKLEFILAEVLKNRKKVIFTFGLAGSNHAVASTIYAKKVGLKCILMLLPQPNAHYLQRNLLLDYYFGANLHQKKNAIFLTFTIAIEIIRQIIITGTIPVIIPPGGSSKIGIIGFVNAAFELKEQIDSGVILEPDYIYLSIGSMGSAIGLILGLKVLGLKSKVISIRVVDHKYSNLKKMMKLFKKVNNYLHNIEPSFPIIKITAKDFNIRHDFFGKQYGLFTKQGVEAAKLIQENEGIMLDGTYTAKTFAAVINDIEKNNFNDKVILFWNTYNSNDLSKFIAKVNYKQLPKKFHYYFTSSVQPLDNDCKI